MSFVMDDAIDNSQPNLNQRRLTRSTWAGQLHAILSSVLILCFSLGSLGCQEWRAEPTPTRLLMAPNRLAADAVTLELGVARLDERQVDDVQTFWRLLDDQEIPLEARKRLDANGLRAAVMSSQPPSVFADLVYPPPIVHEDLSRHEKQLHIKGLLRPESRMVGHMNVTSRNGQPNPIITSEATQSLSWTISDEGRQISGTGEHVRGVFSVAAFPQGDGSVRLVIEPQIHHGLQRDRFGGTEHGFKFKKSQTIQNIESLKFEVALLAGESLVIGPTEDLAMLGKVFFAPPESASVQSAGDEIDEIDLAELDATLDGLALEVNEMQREGDLGDPNRLTATNAEAQLETKEMTDQELLEAEVREMLTVKDGEVAALPELASGSSSEKPKPLHRLLLIRVSLTQWDEFTEVEEVDPLTNVNRY